MGILCISTFIALLLSGKWTYQSIPKAVKCESSPEYKTRTWTHVALPLLLISGMHLVMNRADTLMVGALMDTTQAGVYAVASRVSALALFGMFAVNAIVAPMIAELYADNKLTELQRTVTHGTLASMGFALFIAIGLVFLGSPVLSLFGNAFTAGENALLILLVGQVVSAGTATVGYLLTMTGFQGVSAWITGGGAVLNIVLNAILIPIWGLVGAAFATASTVALTNGISAYFVQRHIGVRGVIGW
jgi:O-antigen/teichoic acid export membrane protein